MYISEEELLQAFFAFLGTYAVVALALTVYLFVVWWKILQKSGDKGWKILIPIYGGYCECRAIDSIGIFWGGIVLGLVAGFFQQMVETGSTLYLVGTTIMAILSLILSIKMAINTSRCFGKSGGFTVGLFFLPIIFWSILAFGSAQHYNQTRALPENDYNE